MLNYLKYIIPPKSPLIKWAVEKLGIKEDLSKRRVNHFLHYSAVGFAFEVLHEHGHELVGAGFVSDAHLGGLCLRCRGDLLARHLSGEHRLDNCQLGFLALGQLRAAAGDKLLDGVFALF